MQRRMRTSLVQLHCFCLREEKELLRVRPIGQGFACSRSLHGARRLTSRQSQRGGSARDFDRGFSAQPSLVVRPAWLILVVSQMRRLALYLFLAVGFSRAVGADVTSDS